MLLVLKRRAADGKRQNKETTGAAGINTTYIVESWMSVGAYCTLVMIYICSSHEMFHRQWD